MSHISGGIVVAITLFTLLFVLSVFVRRFPFPFIGLSDTKTAEEGCFLEGNVFTDENGYSMVWDHCVPKPSGESIYFVRYTDGPHEGKVYRVSQDTDGKSYIIVDSERIYF